MGAKLLKNNAIVVYCAVFLRKGTDIRSKITPP